jgi:hypothetical protein
MNNLFEWMRERLHMRAGLSENKPPFKPSDFATLQKTEWSSRFEMLMRNRLLMGALRYGTMAEKRINATKNRWDLLGAIKAKCELYESTGNTEYLVDMANYCLLAFEFDPHPNKHFQALDDHHDHCKPRRLNAERRK